MHFNKMLPIFQSGDTSPAFAPVGSDVVFRVRAKSEQEYFKYRAPRQRHLHERT
jgi:hypothetical protein